MKDYIEMDVQDKPRKDFSQAERRAYIVDKLLDFGLSPKYMNKARFGRELLGVSDTTIRYDLEAIAQSIEEHHNREDLDVDSSLKLYLEKLAGSEQK